ncbi:MAG: hypothetical protein ACRD68_06030 [Pyrinomonadaceae bacterium]
MFTRALAILLSGILLSAALGLPAVAAQTAEESRRVEKIRVEVAKAGVGKNARVEVKLRDNTKLKGYVSEVGQQSFTVTDSKTGASRAVAYADVTEVKRKGNGLSTRTKVIIGSAAAAGVGIVLYIVRGAFCDGMCV